MHKASSFIRWLSLASLLFIRSAAAGETGITVENAWISEAPPTVSILAAYATISNTSDDEIQLIDVSSPDFDQVEINLSQEQNGMAIMEKQEALSIVANSTV